MHRLKRVHAAIDNLERLIGEVRHTLNEQNDKLYRVALHMEHIKKNYLGLE